MVISWKHGFRQCKNGKKAAMVFDKNVRNKKKKGNHGLRQDLDTECTSQTRSTPKPTIAHYLTTKSSSLDTIICSLRIPIYHNNNNTKKHHAVPYLISATTTEKIFDSLQIEELTKSLKTTYAQSLELPK